MPIFVDKRRCPQNHPCPSVMICPFNALIQKGFSAPQVDENLCTDCGKCTRFCPLGAIQKK